MAVYPSMDESSSTHDESIMGTTTKPVSKPATLKKCKTRRGYNRKLKSNKVSTNLIVIGNNCSGISSKKDSLYGTINALLPSIINL